VAHTDIGFFAENVESVDESSILSEGMCLVNFAAAKPFGGSEGIYGRAVFGSEGIVSYIHGG
jgi:hypothetical protein